MPLNLEKLNTKLAALQAKDVAAITAEQVDIPFLNKPYTEAQLQAWIDKRITNLQNCMDKTEAEVIDLRGNFYQSLNASGKAIADKIIAGEPYTLPENLTGSNYDRLIGIILITFVLN